MTRGLAALLVAGAVLVPAPASADWLLTPFIGTAFAGETTLTDLEQGAGHTKWTVGVSVTLLSDALLGIEGEIGHSPNFFQGDEEDPVVLSSRATTYMANVIVAAPLALTRESLRPYILGGLGVVQTRSAEITDLFSFDRNLAAMNLGAGAVGFLSQRTGLRFDIRYLRAISGRPGLFPRPDAALFSFWRANVGVTIRLR